MPEPAPDRPVYLGRSYNPITGPASGKRLREPEIGHGPLESDSGWAYGGDMHVAKFAIGEVDPSAMLAILDHVEVLLNGIWTDLRIGGAEGEPLDRAAAALAAAKRLSWCIGRALPPGTPAEHPEPVLVFPAQRL
jgi:hypothetical protein